MSDFRVEPLDSTLGATVTNIDLTRLDDQTFKTLYQVWLEHALLIFPDQQLGKEDQVKFSERFGELEFPLDVVSNLKSDGTPRNDPDDDVVKILNGNEGWHCDSTYMPIQSKCAVFSVQVMPSGGGGTAWADMRAAYEALTDEMKENIAPLKAYHSILPHNRQLALRFAYSLRC